MQPERWQRIEALLDSALDLPTGDRMAYLERACGADAALFREVSAILEAGQRSDPVLDASAARLGAPLLPNDIAPAAPPERVGAYRIQRLIGEGGMGSVYLARRDDGQFDQQVALKLVRRGLHLDSRIVRRFREERQILASLNHPGIGRLLDGGLTDDGLPFFAMEYVEGVPIDRYCDAHNLTVEQRLELFARVCDAVAHAHGRQIVHRDIKPSNILVTQNGEPRLLDFGIAKLIGLGDATGEANALTRLSERLLTPEYASPEQIRGEPVVVASDVYCLGVLLYEVLTGQLPFRRAERTSFELERAVLEEDPTRPSEIVQREPLKRRLRGDLDAIVLTAMNKEPARRFPTAAEMAADVRRHLAGQPVVARGTSRAYRMRRWTGRHRLVLASAIVVAIATTVIATAVTRASSPRRVVPGVARRIAFEPEFALDAEVSPDGRRVAFVAGTGTAMRLYVADVGGGRATALAAKVPGFHRWPRWSPDGRQIALMAGARIYGVSADGQTSDRLLVAPDSGREYAAFAVWSPDGTEIAYVQDGAVMVRPVAGGTARRLTSAASPHSLQWSPDGGMIAFVAGNSEFAVGPYPWVSIASLGNAGPSAIWVVPARGGEPTRITEGTSLNTSPVWMPDHRALLYISNRDGARDVYRVELDGRGRPASAPQRVTTGLGAHTISLSRDGRLMAYSNFRVVANVWSVTRADGAERPTLEATPVTRGAQSVEGLALSPDGKWLAFDSDRTGNHHIFTVPADGGEAKQLTMGAVDEFMPHWSPDAKQIAFHAFTRDLARRLEIVSADGGAGVPVTNAPRNQRRPAWSPDGRALVFDAGGNTANDVYFIERAADSGWTAPRRLTSGSSARWSPNGRSIVYVRPDGIWITTAEGGAGRQVLKTDASDQLRLGNAEWSPDSATIYFKRYDGEGRTSFWSVPATGGEARLVVRLDRELRSHRPEFATDGHRFFFTVTERVSDIWTLDLRLVR
jgi:Tol biopolymer transport system component/serine/threonine protein kinase